MTPIPDDIMRKAREALAPWTHNVGHEERVARAIMDERERCAAIADHWATDEQRRHGNGGPKAAILKGDE